MSLYEESKGQNIPWMMDENELERVLNTTSRIGAPLHFIVEWASSTSLCVAGASLSAEME